MKIPAIYEISTDSASDTISAASADAAAEEFARGEGLRRIHTADELREYIEERGGYGSMSADGITIWRVES